MQNQKPGRNQEQNQAEKNPQKSATTLSEERQLDNAKPSKETSDDKSGTGTLEKDAPSPSDQKH